MFDKSYCDCVSDINNDPISEDQSHNTRNETIALAYLLPLLPVRRSVLAVIGRISPHGPATQTHTRGPTQPQSMCVAVVVGAASC